MSHDVRVKLIAESDSSVNSSRSSKPSLGSGAAWIWVALSSLAVVGYAVTPYVTASLADLAADHVGLAEDYLNQPLPVVVAFYAHVISGGIVLLLSPVQFVGALRARTPRLHRWIGRLILLSVAVAGVSALVIAPFSPAGLSGLFGFGMMAALWLGTASAAYRAIRRRDVPSHQAWMIRNFALTYSAVTLRVWMGLLIFAQVPFGGFEFDGAFSNAYSVVPFLGWIPNLVVAELIIRRRGLPALRLVSDTTRIRAVQP